MSDREKEALDRLDKDALWKMQTVSPQGCAFLIGENVRTLGKLRRLGKGPQDWFRNEFGKIRYPVAGIKKYLDDRESAAELERFDSGGGSAA